MNRVIQFSRRIKIQTINYHSFSKQSIESIESIESKQSKQIKQKIDEIDSELNVKVGLDSSDVLVDNYLNRPSKVEFTKQENRIVYGEY